MDTGAGANGEGQRKTEEARIECVTLSKSTMNRGDKEAFVETEEL